MTEKIYWIKNSHNLETALTKIINRIPCFLDREFVEMDYSKITIKTNTENIPFVEKTLAALV